MPESYENKTSEQIGKNIDNLDRDINDLDNKVQEREDFTKYFQDIQDIQNKFKLLDNDIDSITDEEVKKNLKDRLNSLKIKMLDLISDGSINDFINGETKDIAINKMVGQVNEIFYNEIENLVKSLDFGNGMINEILSDATSITGAELMEILQILNFPYGSLSIEGQPYLCFEYPPTGELYALVDGKLRMCEGVLENNEGNNDLGNTTKSQRHGSGTFSESREPASAGLNNTLGEKRKVTYKRPIGKKSYFYGLGESTGIGGKVKIGYGTNLGKTTGKIEFTPFSFVGNGSLKNVSTLGLKWEQKVNLLKNLKFKFVESYSSGISKWNNFNFDNLKLKVKGDWEVSKKDTISFVLETKITKDPNVFMTYTHRI